VFWVAQLNTGNLKTDLPQACRISLLRTIAIWGAKWHPFFMTYRHEIHDELVSVANALADVARAVILPYFRTAGLSAENKLTTGFDPVTVADRAAEQAMCDLLAQMRPDDAIFGEEYGAKSGTSGLTWVLDPIDGTRGFVSGTPTWGVLIAVGDDPISASALLARRKVLTLSAHMVRALSKHASSARYMKRLFLQHSPKWVPRQNGQVLKPWPRRPS
jgi:3'-phosphoadenosine 5'-phosphosulfate (PAPS) 3'-phosphatase